MGKEVFEKHLIIWLSFMVPLLLFVFTDFIDIVFYLYYFVFFFPVILYMKSDNKKIMVSYFLLFYLTIFALIKYFPVSLNLIPFG